ncbi:sesquipedalian [Anaeramoeba flamelloides]|uniref:Sesquipedalian n=1 Tax=Anaeramoeba flamelloides TaxID=1746091 RepID=A0AAV7YQF5_9EUKA|nr:sesquipedalian [Anaeramoeba flamelloides]KAJ6253987.1 sesquipedalian [Anaeramoeba flamelloides]
MNKKTKTKETKEIEEESKVLIEGFFHKQNSRIQKIKNKETKSWKKRYFVLFKDHIQYSIKQNTKILGKIHLYQYQCIIKDDSNERFILRLFKPKEKSLFLEFENQEIMQKWNNQIKFAIENCSKIAYLENEKKTKQQNIEYLKTGWLFKQGNKGLFKKNWKRRFFVLKRKGLSLNYHKTEKLEGVPKGIILLPDIMSVDMATFENEPYGLKISLYSTKRIYKIAADTESERDSWITIIQENATNLYI